MDAYMDALEPYGPAVAIRLSPAMRHIRSRSIFEATREYLFPHGNPIGDENPGILDLEIDIRDDDYDALMDAIDDLKNLVYNQPSTATLRGVRLVDVFTSYVMEDDDESDSEDEEGEAAPEAAANQEGGRRHRRHKKQTRRKQKKRVTRRHHRKAHRIQKRKTHNRRRHRNQKKRASRRKQL